MNVFRRFTLQLICTSLLTIPQSGVFADPTPQHSLTSVRIGHVSPIANEPFFLSGKFSSPTTQVEQTTLAFFNKNKAALGLMNIAKEVRITSMEKDELGHTFVTCVQLVDGTAVYESRVVVQFDPAGKLTTVSGNFIPSSALPATISDTLSVAGALAQVRASYATRGIAAIEQPKAYILRTDQGVFRVYKMKVTFTNLNTPSETVFLDQHSGTIVRTDVRQHELGATTGTGKDVFGKTQSINITQNSTNVYQLKDTSTPALGTILTNTFNRSFHTAQPILSTSKAFTTTPSSVSAHLQTRKVLDFYWKLFGRKGIDNKGMQVVVGTNFGDKVNNAYWDDVKMQMVIGEGDGYTFRPLSSDLSIIGHEFTHGVIQFSGADMAYHNQSGALNESYCDIFGVLIKTYAKYNVANGGRWKFDTADWTIGEVAYTPYNSGDAIRDLANPERYAQPEIMPEYEYSPDTPESDNGGVHTNSGIPNFIAHNIAKNIGMEATARIYYRSFNYLSPDATFYTAGKALQKAAIDIYGEVSYEAFSVAEHFRLAGIDLDVQKYFAFGEPNESVETAFPLYFGKTNNGQLEDANDVDVYRFSIRSGTPLINFIQVGSNTYTIELLDAQGTVLRTSTDQKTTSWQPELAEGSYYLRISSSQLKGFDAYKFGVSNAISYEYRDLIEDSGAGVPMQIGEELPFDFSSLSGEVTSLSNTNPEVVQYDEQAKKMKALALGKASITVITDRGIKEIYYFEVISLNTVTNIRATNRQDNQATLRWSDVPYATGYEVYTGDSLGQTPTLLSRTESPTMLFDNLDYGVKKYVYVKPYVQWGFSNTYGQLSDPFVLEKTAEPPLSFTAKSNGISSIKLDWQMGEVNGYRIYRSTKPNEGFVLIKSLYDSTFTDTNVKLGTTYYYKIQSYLSYGGFVYSSEWVASTGVQPTVGAVTFKSIGNVKNGIQLSWSGVSGATGYEVYRATAQNGPYTAVYKGSATTYSMPNAPTTNSYFFKVRSIRKEAGGTYASPDSAIVVLPKATTGVAMTYAAYNALTYGWPTVPGATGYEIYRAASAAGTYQKIATLGTNSYTMGKLAFNTAYALKVRAYQKVGNAIVYGAYSPAVVGKTNVAIVEGVTALPLTYASVRVNWFKVDGATGYELLRATSRKGPYTKIVDTTALTGIDKTALTGTTYYYAVRAYRKVGTTRFLGPQSEAVAMAATLDAPEGERSNPLSTSSIYVEWEAVQGAQGYEVYSARGASTTFTLAKTTTTTTVKITGLDNGVTYSHKIRAYRVVAGKKVYSTFSAVTSSSPREVKQPGFTFVLPTRTQYQVNQFSISMHNLGELPLRVLSTNTKLIDKTDSSNNRDLTLAYDDGYGPEPMDWLEFEPDETATIDFLTEGGFTTYTKNTIIEFEFIYDSVTYVADCSAEVGVVIRQK